MNPSLSTYYADCIEVNILYKDRFCDKFMWINNLPDNCTLLNEGEQMDKDTLYLVREHGGLVQNDLNEGTWDISYYPAIKENPVMEFIE